MSAEKLAGCKYVESEYWDMQLFDEFVRRYMRFGRTVVSCDLQVLPRGASLIFTSEPNITKYVQVFNKQSTGPAAVLLTTHRNSQKTKSILTPNGIGQILNSSTSGEAKAVGTDFVCFALVRFKKETKPSLFRLYKQK